MQRRDKLIEAREKKHWSREEAGKTLGIDHNTLYRWESGRTMPHGYHIRKLCEMYGKSAEELGLKEQPIEVPHAPPVSELFTTSSGIIDAPPFADVWAEDLLTIYARGIAACQDLYYNGNPQHVEALLPLYSQQTALLAQQTGPLHQAAARLAAQAYQLTCELATDREDFGTAKQAGQQAFIYAQRARDVNVQVHALISLANLAWHLSSAQSRFIQKHSKDALQAYQQAVLLLDQNATPLLKGRTYAGMAEVYALRGQFQEAMRAMGLAYEHFPMKPEDDPAYPYVRASRYSLYVFGDAQARLLLGQPKEAEHALIAMQKETHDPEIEPITKVDLLYYQAEAKIQQGEIQPAMTILTEAALLAKSLGSRLYFNKLAASYHQLEKQWPKERVVTTVEEVFQPW